MENKIIQTIYIFSVVATFILHAFNSIEFGGVKLFYIPAAISFILSVVFSDKNQLLNRKTLMLVLWALFSSIVSPYDGATSRAFTFMVVTVSLFGMLSCDKKKILHIVNAAIPIVLFFLLAHRESDEFGRYQGFYNDPNYLCTTLITYIALIMMEIFVINKKYFQLGLIVEILVILFLVTTTVSRTGLFCSLLLLLLTTWGLFLRYKFQTALVVFIGIGALLYYNPTIIGDTIESYMIRAERGDELSGATDLRKEIALRGVEYVITHPQYLFQGLGNGGTANASCYDGFVVKTKEGDHNTLTSMFSEQGLIGFIIYIGILWYLFKYLYNSFKTSIVHRISFFTFIVLQIFSLSISQVLFYPFWFFLFYTDNININEYENTTYL